MFPANRPAFAVFLRVSLGAAAIFSAAEILLLLAFAHGESWQGSVLRGAWMGVMIGLGVAMHTTSQLMKGVAGNDWRPSDVTWFAGAQWTEVELPFDLLESVALVERELRMDPRMKNVRLNRARQEVAAQALFAGQKLGDRIRVTFTPVGPLDAATTRARIEARPWCGRRLVDIGITKRNAEGIARALNQAVNQRLRSQKEAAEKATLRAELQQARLSLLQAQVEPHFLYNTLASLQLLIRDDAASAQKMTGDLIRYLRLSVPEAPGRASTLGHEIELVRAYVDIMKIRMGERLAVDIAVDDEAAARPFAPLLVHTLVENAIKHGLEPRPEGGRISIGARAARGGALRIVVADTGLGLRPDRQGTGLGLANLRERLLLLYGEQARFTFAPNTPHGVTCTIEIPAPAVGA